MKKLNASFPEGVEEKVLRQIDSLDPTMKSSMQRDMEKLAQVEADHLHGYLLETARSKRVAAPVLETVYANLKVYEIQL